MDFGIEEQYPFVEHRGYTSRLDTSKPILSRDPQGAVSGPDAAAVTDHVCWVYDDEASFAVVARRYLAEGLAGGERLLCVGDTMARTIRR